MNTHLDNNKPIESGFQKKKEQIRAIVATKKFWRDLVIMTLGIFVAALGIYFFLIPSKLIVGSITGLSLVVSHWIPFLTTGTTIFIINSILLVLSFFLIGNEFGAKTVYTALLLGPMIDLLGVLVPMKESLFTTYVAGHPVGNPWFDLLCLVVVLSASQTILFSVNACTGGLDIMAKILHKYLHVSIGVGVIIAGGAICCTALTINSVSMVIIGLIGTWVNGLILNHFMVGVNSKKRVFIVTNDDEPIQNYVVEELKRGLTIHDVVGGYSKEKKKQLEILLTRDEFSKLIAFVKEKKLSTFITADTVSEVYGLWNKKKH
ncbi:MAG: YitT family protein [Prevotella sp.]|nr:YitT family protein [Prevotella sp.]